MLTETVENHLATEAPAVTVVVATRDRAAMLGACLESVRRALRPGDELIVVDSASRDAIAVREVVLAHGGRYLRCDLPGTSLARNTGWQAAATDIVAFVDDDVRVAPTWATALSSVFGRDRATAFLTGRIDVPPEQADAPRPVAQDDRDEPAQFDVATTGPIGHGANVAVLRSALEAVGGFDEQLGPGRRFRASEDYDLFDRLLCSGYSGRYEPAMHAWHDQWRSKRQLIPLDWAYGIGSGARLAKLVRTDRRRLRAAATTTLWIWGIAPLLRDARHRYKLGLLTGVARLAGVVTGFAIGLAHPVSAGHYRGSSG